MFRHACRLGLEGIVSKRATSRYRSGRCAAWVKVKNPATSGGRARSVSGLPGAASAFACEARRPLMRLFCGQARPLSIVKCRGEIGSFTASRRRASPPATPGLPQRRESAFKWEPSSGLPPSDEYLLGRGFGSAPFLRLRGELRGALSRATTVICAPSSPAAPATRYRRAKRAAAAPGGRGGGRGEGQGPDLISYSSTSSVRARITSGTERPSACAVLPFMTNSKRVGCSTGSSPGSAPFRILST